MPNWAVRASHLLILSTATSAGDYRIFTMIEVQANDRLGKKIKVKCLPEDTVGDLKKILSLQLGTAPDKLVLKKGYQVYKDHISLEDYEIHDGFNFELYYG